MYFMDLNKTLSECLSFTLQRKKQDGGFAATPLLPATVEDTYHALKILDSLNKLGLKTEYEPANDESLINWLMRKKTEKEPKVFYQLLRSYQIASLSIDKAQVKHYINSFKGFLDLERYFYLAKLSELAETDLPKINKSFKYKIAKARWMFLYLSEKGFLKSKIDKNEFAQWFIKSQNPDGGFGFSPETTSYMDNTYFCLKALEFLGCKPENLNKILEFILFCQTKSGGFARTSHSAAFLDSTFYAVESLRILKHWLI